MSQAPRLRIDRYLIGEVMGPFLLGLLSYTFIMMIDFFFDSAEMIIRRGVTIGQVGRLLVYYLPSTLVLTVPMAFLFGILVAVGRLGSDSELTAFRSSGLSLWRLGRPLVVMAFLLTLLNGYLMLIFLPRGNTALNDLRIDILTTNITKQVDKRVFYEEWQGVLLYVFDVPQDEDRWKGVFLASTDPTTKAEVQFAEWGEVRVDPENTDRFLLRLGNVVSHDVDPLTPDNYRTSRYRTVDMVLEDPYASDKARARRERYRDLRELSVPELRAQLQAPEMTPALIKKAAKFGSRFTRSSRSRSPVSSLDCSGFLLASIAATAARRPASRCRSRCCSPTGFS